MSHRHLDVLTVTDLRLPGGTAASVAEELRAQVAVGWRSGLLQVDSPLVQHARPLNPRLAALIDEREVELVVGRDEPVSCRVLVLRHPSVVAALDPTTLPTVVADRVVMVANQSPGTPAGDPVHYEPTVVDAHLRTWLGPDVDVVWAPIGPLVRENLALIAPAVTQADTDWVNVIDVAAWAVDRTEGITGTPVIGRHSRNSPHKWPADRATLLAAYPADAGFAVEVLGGATPAEDVLGGAVPRNWRVRRFGTVPPERFLADIDVFVYFHHPDWVEAFGRTILEALASGAPVIVPHHFAPVFGDACCYATPEEVGDIVRRLAAHPEEYRAWSERGRAFVDERFGHRVHVARIAALLEEPAPVTPAVAPAPSSIGPRVLFVSSNGAGVGHLMRLMSMARRAERLEPVFLTLSQAITVVRDQGYPVEYLASRQYTDVPVAAWHRLLCDRVVDLIDRHRVTAVVFDGTWPYRGLFQAVQERPDIHLVWSRRAMWREGVTNPMIDEADRFSLILEPGEVASDADRGITTYLRDGATRVDPITFLDHTDQVDRATARAEMGLDPDRPAALVQLGAGNINDTSSLVGMVVAALATEPDLQICVTRSVIASDPGDLGADVRTISVYPLARYLAAFDLAVAASGYNTYHELVAAPVPTLFIPNLETSTDDQTGRARFAERVGIGRVLVEVTPEGLTRALAPLLDPDQRRRMRELAEGRRLGNGAGAAIRAIEDLVTSRTRPPAAAQRPVKQRGTAVLAPGAPTLDRTPNPAPVVPTTDPTSRPPAPSRTGGVAVTIRRAAMSPRVRGLARSVYARLPTATQDALRDTLGIARPARRAAGGSVRLPIPPGTLLPEGERDGLDGLVLLLDETLDGPTLREVVDLVAALQVTHRRFAPLFVTGSADAGTFRRFGYQFEYLPDATTWTQLSDEADRRDHLRVRLGDIVRRYEARAVVPVASAEDVRRLVVPVVS